MFANVDKKYFIVRYVWNIKNNFPVYSKAAPNYNHKVFNTLISWIYYSSPLVSHSQNDKNRYCSANKCCCWKNGPFINIFSYIIERVVNNTDYGHEIHKACSAIKFLWLVGPVMSYLDEGVGKLSLCVIYKESNIKYNNFEYTLCRNKKQKKSYFHKM